MYYLFSNLHKISEDYSFVNQELGMCWTLFQNILDGYSYYYQRLPFRVPDPFRQPISPVHADLCQTWYAGVY